jgi:hypothetical protein
VHNNITVLWDVAHNRSVERAIFLGEFTAFTLRINFLKNEGGRDVGKHPSNIASYPVFTKMALETSNLSKLSV